AQGPGLLATRYHARRQRQLRGVQRVQGSRPHLEDPLLPQRGAPEGRRLRLAVPHVPPRRRRHRQCTRRRRRRRERRPRRVRIRPGAPPRDAGKVAVALRTLERLGLLLEPHVGHPAVHQQGGPEAFQVPQGRLLRRPVQGHRRPGVGRQRGRGREPPDPGKAFARFL
ncbi:hypothetical protein CFC21_021528, partial [Triticum aestivum]